MEGDQKQVGLVKKNIEIIDPLIQIDLVFSVFEALRLFRLNSYDCIVSNHSPPEINGIKLAYKIKKIKNIPYVLYLNYINEEDKIIALDAKVDEIIIKKKNQGSYHLLTKKIRDLVKKYRAENINVNIHTLFDKLNEGIIISRPDSTILFANNAAANLLGFSSPQELVGNQTTKFFSSEHREKLIREFKEKDFIPNLEVNGKTKDGVQKIFQASIFANNDKQGRLHQIEAIFRDVTENKLIEEELKKSQERYKLLFDLAPDPIIITDMHGVITSINSVALKNLANSVDDVIGKHFSKLKLLRKRDLPQLMKIYSSTLKGENPEPFEVSYKGKNGSESWAEVHVQIFKVDGRKEGIIAVVRDISERKITETNIKTSEEKWRSLIEMAPDGILTLNMKGYITSVNSAFLKLSGYTEEEIINKHFLKVGTIKARDILRSSRIFADIVRGKTTGPIEFTYQRKDGSDRWGDARCRLLKIGNKTQILVIARDITEREKIEEDLKKSVEELARSNKELDDYTYAVSHDLKAPLRAVEAFAGFLIEDYTENLDETGKGYLTRIKDASIRMKTLIDDLLSLSRVGRMYTEIELVDLDKLIEEIRLDFETQLEEGKAEIISSGLPSIRTQRIWIKQLFSNLISNGLKFNKSRIPKVWVGYEEQGDYHLFSVKDNGIGIEKVHQEKIFKIFQRLHSQDEYPGTGAGLTICKKIVETLSGSIWVESKPGAGSTFYFTIPKGETDDMKVSDYPHQVDQSIIQVQEELTNHVE